MECIEYTHFDGNNNDSVIAVIFFLVHRLEAMSHDDCIFNFIHLNKLRV